MDKNEEVEEEEEEDSDNDEKPTQATLEGKARESSSGGRGNHWATAAAQGDPLAGHRVVAAPFTLRTRLSVSWWPRSLVTNNVDLLRAYHAGSSSSPRNRSPKESISVVKILAWTLELRRKGRRE
ncbi:hypothetical protein E2C01_089634 [Portunus trituberculatus]|uniref:Uncharacterized protein n=1 Tax=Portunus trituberculatus TaxID=210409 RepID=A0A5B7JJB4_PORTR|nr:hypothetical protein [Portunus trituberculatus]